MRLPDWPERLASVIDARLLEPFQYGTHDCVIFAAACVKAVTGKNALHNLPTWGTEEQAQEVIKQVGGLRLAMNERFEPCVVMAARRGDLVGVDTPEGMALGVVIGACAAVPSKRGALAVPLCDCVAAWRVE